MAKCISCGRRGLFIRLKEGLCKNCSVKENYTKVSITVSKGISNNNSISNSLLHPVELKAYQYKNDKQYEEGFRTFEEYLRLINSKNETYKDKLKIYFAQLHRDECLYKLRDNTDYQDKLISCFESTSRLYLELLDKCYYCSSYHYLVQTLIKQGNYREAIKWCDIAISFNMSHRSQNGYSGIKEKIIKKSHQTIV